MSNSSSSNANKPPQQHVRVGVGVIVRAASGRLYAGIRKSSHGAGSIALPGGHLELYETWESCAQREVKEEMNLDLQSVQFAHVTNDIMRDEHKHYVTIFMSGRPVDKNAVPENMEPHKCEGWNEYTWDELKALVGTGKLFGPLEKLVQDEPPVVSAYLNKE